MSDEPGRGPQAAARSLPAGSEPRRFAVLGACFLLMVGAGVLGCGGDDDGSPTDAGGRTDESAPISAYGLRVELPPGWDGRIWWPEDDDPHGFSMPKMHLASFPLPASDGSSFGEDVTPTIGGGQIFAALVEDSPASAGAPRFAGKPPTGLGWEDLDRSSVKVGVEGQVGAQELFTENGRAFTLLVVASEPRGQAVLDELNEALASLEIDPDRDRGSRRPGDVGPSVP